MLYFLSGGRIYRETRIMYMYIYFTLVSVPTNCGERHVLDAVCWPALISRASLRSSGVNSAVYSTWYQMFLLFIYRHYFLWHIDSSVVSCRPFFESLRSVLEGADELDQISLLFFVTYNARFSPSWQFCFAIRHGRFTTMLWRTLFICFITFYIP